MKFAIISLTLALLAISASSSIAGDQYSSKYDNINVDDILHSDRLLKNYVNCVLDRGPCGPDATELKKYLPEAISTQCAKCSDKQKALARKVIDYIRTNKPDLWKEIRAKFDPTGALFQKYQQSLRA